MLTIEHLAPVTKKVPADCLEYGLCRHGNETLYLLREEPGSGEPREAVRLSNGYIARIDRAVLVEPLTATLKTKHLEVHP